MLTRLTEGGYQCGLRGDPSHVAVQLHNNIAEALIGLLNEHTGGVYLARNPCCEWPRSPGYQPKCQGNAETLAG